MKKRKPKKIISSLPSPAYPPPRPKILRLADLAEIHPDWKRDTIGQWIEVRRRIIAGEGTSVREVRLALRKSFAAVTERMRRITKNNPPPDPRRQTRSPNKELIEEILRHEEFAHKIWWLCCAVILHQGGRRDRNQTANEILDVLEPLPCCAELGRPERLQIFAIVDEELTAQKASPSTANKSERKGPIRSGSRHA